MCDTFQSSKIRNKQSSLLQRKVSLSFLHGDNWQRSSGKHYLFCDKIHSLRGKHYCLGIFQRKILFGWWIVFKILVKWLRPLKEIPRSRVHGSGEILLNAEIFFLCFEMANTSLLCLRVDCADNKKVSLSGISIFFKPKYTVPYLCFPKERQLKKNLKCKGQGRINGFVL